MIGDRTGARLPIDVIACAVLIGGSGIVFLLVGLVRLFAGAGVGVLQLPVVAFALQLGAAAALLFGLRPARPVIMIVTLLVVLLYVALAIAPGGAWWTRVVTAVLAAANVYALVLFNTRPVREHFGIGE